MADSTINQLASLGLRSNQGTLDQKTINEQRFKEAGLGQAVNPNTRTETQDFMELFVAQLRNQNPMEPQDGHEFLGQLAQFSTVEGIKNMESSMDSLSESMQSSQAITATSLVGRKVEVKSNQIDFNPEAGMKGSIELPNAVSNLNIQVQDSSGRTVYNFDMGHQAQGNVPFNWNGTMENDEIAPGGNYRIKATGIVNDKNTAFETYVSKNVDSVTLKQNGVTMLNINGHGAVSLTDIRNII